MTSSPIYLLQLPVIYSHSLLFPSDFMCVTIPSIPHCVLTFLRFFMKCYLNSDLPCPPYLMESPSVMWDSLRSHSPWKSSGQNTGVGSLSLLRGKIPVGKIPNSGTEPRSPTMQVDSLLTELSGKPWAISEAQSRSVVSDSLWPLEL